MNFNDFKLHPQIQAGVDAAGYAEPTPIQVQAIPPALAGSDVLGLAQTGTGKTAAFALPILQRLLSGPRGRVRALIVAPTRELADQIAQAFRDLGKKTGLRTATVYGGVAAGPQIAAVKGRAEIVVACPGRLLDLMDQRAIDLSAVEVLVLDEADRMFDMGFLPDVRRILRSLPGERQNMLFSATMPDDIRRLANEVLVRPVTVQIDFAAPAKTVSHALYPVAAHRKTSLLMHLLRGTDTDSVLIFARTKHRARKLAEQLEREGFKSTALQGNMSQNARQAALSGFRTGRYKIMVATDIAARGLDVSQISHVINYDIPDTVDAYTHRIGRTGRAARTGDAFTLVSLEDSPMVREIERVLGSQIERCTVEGFDYMPGETELYTAPVGQRSNGRGIGRRGVSRPAPAPRPKPESGPTKEWPANSVPVRSAAVERYLAARGGGPAGAAAHSSAPAAAQPVTPPPAPHQPSHEPRMERPAGGFSEAKRRARTRRSRG